MARTGAASPSHTLFGVYVGLILWAGLALRSPALRSLLASFGIDLPSTGTVIEARTIIVGLAVGMLATVVSGFVPAWRAARAPTPPTPTTGPGW